jgi:DNA-directed RNA polymerase subunit RPC12/RpoP
MVEILAKPRDRTEYSKKYYEENKDKELARKRAWNIKNREKIKLEPCRSSESRHEEYLKGKENLTNYRLLRDYGISLEQRKEMLEFQDYKCAICKYPFNTTRDIHTDHNHETNQVRALLCRACNHLVGNCKESIDILLQAIEYLNKHN